MSDDLGWTLIRYLMFFWVTGIFAFAIMEYTQAEARKTRTSKLPTRTSNRRRKSNDMLDMVDLHAEATQRAEVSHRDLVNLSDTSEQIKRISERLSRLSASIPVVKPNKSMLTLRNVGGLDVVSVNCPTTSASSIWEFAPTSHFPTTVPTSTRQSYIVPVDGENFTTLHERQIQNTTTNSRLPRQRKTPRASFTSKAASNGVLSLRPEPLHGATYFTRSTRNKGKDTASIGSKLEKLDAHYNSELRKFWFNEFARTKQEPSLATAVDLLVNNFRISRIRRRERPNDPDVSVSNFNNLS